MRLLDCATKVSRSQRDSNAYTHPHTVHTPTPAHPHTHTPTHLHTHSYVSSWTSPDEAHYSAMQGLTGKLNPDNFADWVDEILSETDGAKRQANWTELLTEVHEEVTIQGSAPVELLRTS